MSVIDINSKQEQTPVDEYGIGEKMIKEIAIGLIKEFGIDTEKAVEFAIRKFREKILIVSHSVTISEEQAKSEVNLQQFVDEQVKLCFDDIGQHILGEGLYQAKESTLNNEKVLSFKAYILKV